MGIIGTTVINQNGVTHPQIKMRNLKRVRKFVRKLKKGERVGGGNRGTKGTAIEGESGFPKPKSADYPTSHEESKSFPG